MARARRCLGPVDGDRGILARKIKSDGRYEEQLYSPGGGTRRPPSAETLAAGDHFFKMKGNELFKVAVRSMAEFRAKCLEKPGLTADDVNFSFRTRRISESPTRWPTSSTSTANAFIQTSRMHGNTSSASIPIALDECVEAGRIKEGDLVLLASFGGGVTWGGVLMRW